MFLPHSSEELRAQLILKQRTIEDLKIDPDSLGRHSSVEIFFKCVVCSEPHKLSKKRILDGKGLTHPGPCRTLFRQAGGIRARENENPQHKQVRAQKLREKIAKDGSAIASKRKQTLTEKYGTAKLSEIEPIRQKISEGVKKTITTSIEKRKKTNIIKYGATNFLASEQGTLLIKKHNQATLGCDYPFQSNSIRKKNISSMQERYGVDNAQKLPENRLRLKQWCEDNPEKLFTSKGEQQVLDWVRRYYPLATKFRKDSYELDIFIPELNLGIEYNGLFWHSESCKSRNYHLEKTKFFEKHGIRVIHVFENEWRTRSSQIQSFLLSAIGQNSIRISPRHCKIVWSSASEEIKKAHELLDQVHIQGHANNTKFVTNTYYKEQLVATASFGMHHRNVSSWVLTRFCTKTDYSVRGLLAKISKLAFQELQQPIISWADYRLSQGNGYEKAGWKKSELLPPDYFYFKITTGEVISKQSRQKKLIGTPEHITEWEHAQMDGLERIWDCGKIRYIFNHQ